MPSFLSKFIVNGTDIFSVCSGKRTSWRSFKATQCIDTKLSKYSNIFFHQSVVLDFLSLVPMVLTTWSMNTQCDGQFRAECQLFSTVLVWSAISCLGRVAWSAPYYQCTYKMYSCYSLGAFPCVSVLAFLVLCTQAFSPPIPDCQFNILLRPGKYSCLVKFFSYPCLADTAHISFFSVAANSSKIFSLDLPSAERLWPGFVSMSIVFIF